MTNTRISHLLAAAREQALRKRLDPIVERLVDWRPLPPILLLAALSTVFIFSNDRGNFYRTGHHDYVTADHLGIARNLSPAHNFLMFRFQALTHDGVAYQPYNRFPIGAHALIKLFILPFSHGSVGELYAARVLMLVFFGGSAILAYLALGKILSNQWIALTATMLAFSSTYALYYNDMVAPDGITTVFGIFLTLHGLIVFSQENKKAQLFTKIAISLLLGWPVLIFLILFSLSGFMKCAIVDRKNLVKSELIFRNIFIQVGSFSLLISGILLGFNIINESVAINENPLDTPSLNSLKIRTTGFEQTTELDTDTGDEFGWNNVISNSFTRISAASSPFSIPTYPDKIVDDFDTSLNSHSSIAGMIIFFASVTIILSFSKQKTVLIPLILSGPTWILLFRYHSIIHDFTALLLIPIPLISSAFFLDFLARHSKSTITFVMASASIALFIFSTAQMGYIGHSEEAGTIKEQIRHDFENIREKTTGRSVFLNLPEDREYYPYPTQWYYLSGSIIAHIDHREEADYFVTNSRSSCGLMTPDNQHIFLYNGFTSFAECEIEILDGDPVYRDALLTPYHVYLTEEVIHYASEGACGQHENSSETFFLHVYPVTLSDIPSRVREYGFTNLDFQPMGIWQDIEGHCIIRVQLPQYSITSIQTGQYNDEGKIWSADIRVAQPE